jgi:hypothetical protein
MRRAPYTGHGISRVPCQRCGAPSSQQWQVCATDNEYAGVCNRCDVDLNALVVEFMGLPKTLIADYAAKRGVSPPPAGSPVSRAASAVLSSPRQSKAAKVARGSALTAA